MPELESQLTLQALRERGLPTQDAVTVERERLAQFLRGGAYQQYVYGYPHKTAYRPFEAPKPLDEVWANERVDSRFLYVHVPFCEMRCGFCNLFTTVNPAEHVVERFITQLEIEARETARAMPSVTFTRAAIGGGTPSALSVDQLRRVMAVLRETMGFGRAPLSVELSPSTVDRPKLEALSGATRWSLGVQSFVEAEVAAVKRPQANADVFRTLDLLREVSSADLNVDLIYGMAGQTETSLVGSLETALRWRPEELYLYPLYVRPLTFLGKRGQSWNDHRRSLYRVARDWLVGHGYVQKSMRVFQRADVLHAQVPEYHAEADGMVGLGVGARSYTKAVHYAHDWAVEPRAVRSIIDEYLARPAESFREARAGFELSDDEQRRRFVVLTLFGDGLSDEAFRRRFGSSVRDALPWLSLLEDEGLASWRDDTFTLTPLGLEWSDAVGPWLFSSQVEEKMRAWEAK